MGATREEGSTRIRGRRDLEDYDYAIAVGKRTGVICLRLTEVEKMVFRRMIEALERSTQSRRDGESVGTHLRKQDELRAGLDALGDIIAAMDGT
jgi:hypothetical protein